MQSLFEIAHKRIEEALVLERLEKEYEDLTFPAGSPKI